MKINRDYEMEISLKDLFFHLLYRWRSILVGALVGAILLGSYQYMNLTLTHRKGKLTKAEKQFYIDLQEFRDNLANYRKGVRDYTNLIKEKNEYLDNSVYMALDPENEWVASRRYYIKVDQAVLDELPQGLQEDPADRVAMAYTSTLKTNLDKDEMEALLGTGQKEYIDELVGIGSDSGSNTISIWVIGPDQETVIRQMSYFADRLTTVCSEVAQEVEPHTLTLMLEDVRTRIDNDLSAKQSEYRQQIIDLQHALKDNQEKLNRIEDKKEPKKPVGIKKKAVIGFILGAFLLAAFYVAKYVFEALLRSCRELTEHFGLPVYGEFRHSRARKPGKGLDKLIEKWEFKHARTDEAVADEVVALLRERHQGNRILLTGTVSKEKLDDLGKKLGAKLSDAVELYVEGDFLTNSAAITSAAQAQTVVLVEQKHASRVKDIEREAELLITGKANVAGCVVI